MEGLPLSFDPKIFLFSLVNFAILFFILKKFFFAPVYDILEKRKKKIKESLEQVEHIKIEREKLDTQKDEILSNAEKKSQEILNQAEKLKKEILDKGKNESEKIIKESRESIEKEREDLKDEMKSSLIDLVSIASDKVLSNINKEGQQNALIEKSILQSLQESGVEMDTQKK